MSERGSKKVAALVTDLFFMAKIKDAAGQAGLSVRFAMNGKEAVEVAEELPELMILDLNCAAADSLQVIRSLKGREDLKDIPLVGFVSHVQADRRQHALDAGCDTVVPRSAFVQRLPEILGRRR